jgi:hypothetical protein
MLTNLPTTASALCDTTSTSAVDVQEQAMPLTCSADNTNASKSGYVVVSSDGSENINSVLVFFSTQNIDFTLVFFAVVLVAFACLVTKHTPIASALTRLPASSRSTKQRKNPRDDARNEHHLMARVAELVTKMSCRANTASVTAAGVLVTCTSAALWFTSSLVRGPAAVASIVLVLVLYYGCVSYLVHS